MHRTSVSLLLAGTAFCCSRPASAEMVQPSLTAEGRIVAGAKSIWQKPGYGQLILCIDNDVLCNLFDLFNFGEGDINVVFFMNSGTESTPTGALFRGDVRASPSSEEKLGTYQLDLGLLDNGLVKIESACRLDPGVVPEARAFHFKVPDYMNLRGEYVKGGRTIPFDENASAQFDADELQGAALNLFPEDPGKAFSIRPDDCSEIRIHPHAIVLYAQTNGVTSFRLDIRQASAAGASSEALPNGIDFWDVDGLHLPDYGACRNLVPNPSFEAGFHYWGHPTYTHSAIPLKYAHVYELDGREAHSGSQSLRIRALPMKNPLPLGTFATPFVPDQPYTVSLYAKGSSDDDLSLMVWGRGQRDMLFTNRVVSLAVDRTWKRYEVPFVPRERFCAVYFYAQGPESAGDEEASVWIDDVQIEQGGPTDFVQPPMSAQLASAARGNFLRFGQKPEFKLLLHAPPGTRGTVSLTVEDFFFKTIFEDSFPFVTDLAGGCVVPLDALSDKVATELLRGVFMVSSRFAIEGRERPYQDYFRFSVMDFLENKHRNKNLFNLTYVYSLQAAGPEMERFVERERAVGFGSIAYDFIKFANDLDLSLDEERMRLVEAYGFEVMGRPVLKLHDGEGGEISEENGAIRMQNVKHRIDPTEAELAVFESICARKAARRPWNTLWWFTGESNPGCMPLESHPEAFARFLLATLRGIKKGNPQARVLIEGGPWTMETQHGAAWTERYIQDTRKLDPSAEFDGAACHYYRNFPENPDLDAEAAGFLEMLDRNGCGDWPVYWNEGGNYCPFNIPQEGISPYVVHSANAWYIGPLSYHVGRSERISAAFSARNWLVALKYQDRVACMQDFMTPNRYVDFDFTPRPYEKIPNTLGRILGNASFSQDIRFAPFCRCYVFKEDATGAPIAAIWGHKESVDRWKESPPLYAFDFGELDLVVIDLMENEVDPARDADGRTVLPMSPFPLFIRGRPGDEAELCRAIAGAAAAVADPGVVDIVAFPAAPGEAALVFRNTVSREFHGTARIVLNGVETRWPLQLKPLEEREERVAWGQASPAIGALLDFDCAYDVEGGRSGSIANPAMLLTDNAGPAVGAWDQPAEWKDLPAVDLGSGLSMKASIAQGHLLVALESRDPGRAAEDVFAGTGLYVDPFDDPGAWTATRAARQDVAVFEFIKTQPGSLAAMCHFVQGTQAGSGSGYLVPGQVQKRIRVAAFSEAGTASMVFAVPQEVLAPLKLEPGRRFGLNLSVPVKGGGWDTLAPVQDFESPAEPGEIRFVRVLVCTEDTGSATE